MRLAAYDTYALAHGAGDGSAGGFVYFDWSEEPVGALRPGSPPSGKHWQRVGAGSGRGGRHQCMPYSYGAGWASWWHSVGATAGPRFVTTFAPTASLQAFCVPAAHPTAPTPPTPPIPVSEGGLRGA